MTHLTSSSEGTYISRKLCPESANMLVEFCKHLKITDIIDPLTMHTTICYSRNKINPEIQLSPLTVESKCVFEPLGNAFVMRIISDELMLRFEELKKLGATWDFEDYIPHITVSSNINQDPIFITNTKLFLVLCAEVMEPLDLDFSYDS